MDESALPRGYENDFTETIPDSLSCSLCLLPLRDPHLLDCCGVKMCAPCVGRVEAADRSCPHCKEQFVHMQDKGTAHQVLSLKTRCSRKRKHGGCEWEGELRDLSRHERDECDWALAECQYGCGERVSKRLLAEHERDVCEQRPLNVKLDSIVALMEERHQREIDCVKEKFERILYEERERQERDLLEKERSLLMKVEQLEEMMEEKYRRKIEKLKQAFQEKDRSHSAEIEQFRELLDQKENHLKELITVQEEVSNEGMGEIQTIKEMVEEQNLKIDRFQASLNIHLLLTPCDLVMPNYYQHKDDRDVWMSPPFYSEAGGYKLRLHVHAYGEGAGEGTAVSVFVHLMKGEFDDRLQWPFRRDIHIQLMNQLSDAHHYRMCLDYTNAPLQSAQRVPIDGEIDAQGWGFVQFIQHSAMEFFTSSGSPRRLIMNGCLKFRISIPAQLGGDQ